MSDIKAILWDVDGTILDFKAAQKNAIRACFEHFYLGNCSDEMLAVYDGINTKYWKALERGELTREEVLLGRFYEFFNMYGLNTNVVPDFNEMYQVRLGDTICFYPGVKEALVKFKDMGILQYAVTNGTKVAQDRKLSRSGLIDIFENVYISEEVGYEKPNQMFFWPVLLDIRQHIPNIEYDQILIVGDSLTSDMQGGINAGIATCWYKHPGEVNDRYMKLDHIITDFARLVDIVIK